MRFLVAVALPVFALFGCAEQDVLKYQGRPAQTALECEAAYQAARKDQASTPAYANSGASLLGAAIGRGIVHGMTDSHFKACLARVASIDPLASAASPPAVAAPVGAAPDGVAQSVTVTKPAPTPGCVPGGGVMQGGTGYCIGN